jgi:hypothetical protein
MVMTSAQRTIEILGQVLRNAATAKKIDDKLEIATVVFDLGRRILSTFYNVSGERVEELIARFEMRFRERFPNAEDDEIEQHVQHHIFNLHWFLSFAVFKHVASAVGDQDLDETFDRLLQQDQSIPNRMYKLAITLDRPLQNLPVKDAESLHNELRTNDLGQLLVRSLVVDHLYLYRVSAQERQRICEKVNIPVPTGALDPHRKKLGSQQ